MSDVPNPQFQPGPAYNPGAAPAPVAVNVGDPNASAKQIIADTLARWGLGTLTPTAWDLIVSGAGGDEVVAKIRQTPEYAQRFAGNIERQKAGYQPLSEAEYLSRENSYRDQLRLGGLPPTFYDQPSDFADLIGRGVSVQELNQRITQGYVAVSQADPATRAVFAEHFGPTSDNALAAFFIDPDKAVPTLERMVTEAQIGGAASRFGIGTDWATTQRLAGLGVTQSQALQGFSQIADLGQVFNPTITEPNDVTAAGTGVASVIEGQAGATRAIKNRQAARQSAFDETGGALATSGGVLGLGTVR